MFWRCDASSKQRGRADDLKRGPGGLADIEFIVQYLQLLHSVSEPDLLQPNIWEALAALRRRRILTSAVCALLRDAYELLRTIELRLRLFYNRSVSVLPEERGEIERLARRLTDESADPLRAVESFLAEVESKTQRTREMFEQIVVAQATG